MTPRRTALFLLVASLLSVRARGDHTAGAPAPSVLRSFDPAVRHAHQAGARAPLRLAVTVDDLPGGGPEVLGYSHVQMVKDIIAVLQRHHVVHAAGFIIGSMIDSHPERSEALDAWVQAGFLVGNHSYSHDRIAELGLARFMDDIVKNRAVVDPLERRLGQHHSYFRFPYLEEGTTHRERSALWQLLQSQRYTLVRVSVTFGDTDWADAYLRCTEQGDRDSLAALDQSYLENAIAQLHWSNVAAREVLGHAIPFVLLVHVNMPTAKNLDALLQAYEAEGVQFVPLEEALREPAYAAYYDVPGGALLDQASLHLGRPHPPELVEPDVLIDRFCR